MGLRGLLVKRREKAAKWEEEAASAARDNTGLRQFNMVLKLEISGGHSGVTAWYGQGLGTFYTKMHLPLL